jgi:hypothetical protein
VNPSDLAVDPDEHHYSCTAEKLLESIICCIRIEPEDVTNGPVQKTRKINAESPKQCSYVLGQVDSEKTADRRGILSAPHQSSKLDKDSRGFF